LPLFFSRTEIIDLPTILMTFAAVAFLLTAIYETKNRRMSKRVNLFYAVAIGLGIGFIIFAVITTFTYIVEYTLQNFLLLLVIVLSYTFAFIIGILLSKKCRKDLGAKTALYS